MNSTSRIQNPKSKTPTFSSSGRGAKVTSQGKEGFERRTKKDFAHFLDLSKGSSGEVRSMLYLAEDLGYVAADTAKELRSRYLSLSTSIGALASRLRNS